MEECSFCGEIIVLNKATGMFEAEYLTSYCQMSNHNRHVPHFSNPPEGFVKPVEPMASRMPGVSHWRGCYDRPTQENPTLL